MSTKLQPVRKAVFPVGGLGTRFLPATKSMPKEMLTVVDKPLIQYAVEEALNAGIEEIIFVTGRGKSAIEDHFDHSYELESVLRERRKFKVIEELNSLLPKEGHISYTRQHLPLGLGHAIWCARELVGNEPFAVLLADDLIHSDTPCLKQMLEAYNQVGGNIVASMQVPHHDTNKYGIIDAVPTQDNLIKINGLVEKPDPKDAPTDMAIVGRYILQPDVFVHLSEKKRGAGGEVQLTDAMAQMLGHTPFHGLKFEGTRYDCGDKAGYLKANIALALTRPELQDEVRDFIKSLKL